MHLCSVSTIIAPDPRAAPCELQLPQTAPSRAVAGGVGWEHAINGSQLIPSGKEHFPHQDGICSLGDEMKNASLGFGLRSLNN